MPELVWKIVEEDERVVKGMIEAGEEWNLYRGNWDALKGLRRDNTVVI